MKITFLIPPLNLSGGIRVIAIYASLLTKRGHQVEILALPRAVRSFRSKLKSVLTGEGWPKNHETQLSHLDLMNVPYRILSSVNPSADEFPAADLVLATFWRTAPVVAALPPSKGKKAIFLQGYETSPGQESPEIDAVWRLPLKKIVISEWMVKLANERFGDLEVFHVPNSVDLDQFHAPPRDKQLVPTVGMLYGSIHLKGVDVANAALELVRKEFPDLRIIAFGAEPVSTDVPLPKNAEYHMCPPQNEIRQLYAKCDVWICGSRREGFHLPPLEAMACRCPVVSTKVGGPLDIIKDGENGFLVELEDSENLAKNVSKLLNMDNSIWQRFSDAAHSTAVKYSWEDATSLFEQSLQKICNEDFQESDRYRVQDKESVKCCAIQLGNSA